MPDQVLHPVREFGDTAIGDRQSVVIAAHHRLRRHEFLDVPVGKKNNGGRRIGRPLSFRSLGWRGRLNVRQLDKPETTLPLVGESIDCRPVLFLESRDLRLEFRNLDFCEDAFDSGCHWLSQ